VLATPRWNSTVGGCRPARPYRRSCRSFLHLLFNQRPDEEEEEEDEAVGCGLWAARDPRIRDAIKIRPILSVLHCQ